MNESGLVFWLLVAASLCCVLIAIGLLGSVLYVSGLEAERERRERGDPR